MKKKMLPRKGVKYLLIQYVQLRTQMSTPRLAKEMGVNYHSLVKTLKKLPRRMNPGIREAVAKRLGVAYEDIWGEGSHEQIKKLINDEIGRKSIECALELSQFLQKQVIS